SSEGMYRIAARATLYQKDTVALKELAKEYGVNVHPGKGCNYVTLHGKKAVQFMELVKNYLVIKREVVEYLLSIVGQHTDDIRPYRMAVKEARVTRTSEKDYPSRR